MLLARNAADRAPRAPTLSSHRAPAPASAPDPRLARGLLQWLVLGALLMAFPAVRAPSLWFGAGAFWLLGAPLVSLAMLYRHAVAAAWRGILVPAPRRRRPRSAPRQARRLGFGPVLPRSRQQAA